MLPDPGAGLSGESPFKKPYRISDEGRSRDRSEMQLINFSGIHIVRIPAPLDKQKTEEVQHLGRAAFRALDVSGMARVDFLIDRSSEKIYVNELNTIPGFTSISMYPKLWEATGLPMPRLVDRLIELALEKAELRAKMETHYHHRNTSSA